MWFWLGIWAIMLPIWFFKVAIINNPIDEQGLDVDYIKTRFVKGQFAVFIFVHRDYPTTVSLTAERRLKLLHLQRNTSL
jgi:DNA-binding transcriptional MocR family regulator